MAFANSHAELHDYYSPQSGFGGTGAVPGGPFGGAYGGDYGAFAEPEEHWDMNEIQGKKKAGLLVARRKRLNIVPILLGLFVPWGLFCACIVLTSTSIQYKTPLICYSCLAVTLIGLLGMLLCALDAGQKKLAGNPLREPTWLIFVFLTGVVMWFAGVAVGEMIYLYFTRPFHDLSGLSMYTDVDPARMRGSQLMDASRIAFTENSQLDLSKAMVFKNIETFCVAPVMSPTVVNETAEPKSYDFWAVGKNCCGLNKDQSVSYHCGNYNSQHAHGGVREMNDADRPYYRLAVQQAEAGYGIHAVHPLFFSWVVNPVESVDALVAEATLYRRMGIATAFTVQLFFVVVAAVAFTRLGKL